MKVRDFLNITKEMSIKDFDIDEETGYVEVQYSGNYVGSIHFVFENNGALFFSVTPKDENPKWYETAHFMDLSEIREECKGYEELPLYFYSKSQGVFSIESVSKVGYNYSEDGDGTYEACKIKCSDEPVAESLDRIQKINTEDYEDFFENLMEKYN